MIDLQSIRHIAFDADDTLWKNEDFYHGTEVAFGELLAPYVGADCAQKVLFKTESKNMALLGYGAKAMTISMVEAAMTLVDHPTTELVNCIIALGKKLLEMPTILLPGAFETVVHFAKTRHVFILTKGDLLEQERKFENSPFKDMGLEYIVLSGKEPKNYSKILNQLQIEPSEFMMIGNSPKSDILAPLSIGATAAYVPYKLTWAHEHVDLDSHDKLITLNAIDELIKLDMGE